MLDYVLVFGVLVSLCTVCTVTAFGFGSDFDPIIDNNVRIVFGLFVCPRKLEHLSTVCMCPIEHLTSNSGRVIIAFRIRSDIDWFSFDLQIIIISGGKKFTIILWLETISNKRLNFFVQRVNSDFVALFAGILLFVLYFT